jgi:hypothetical protein
VIEIGKFYEPAPATKTHSRSAPTGGRWRCRLERLAGGVRCPMHTHTRTHQARLAAGAIPTMRQSSHRQADDGVHRLKVRFMRLACQCNIVAQWAKQIEGRVASRSLCFGSWTARAVKRHLRPLRARRTAYGRPRATRATSVRAARLSARLGVEGRRAVFVCRAAGVPALEINTHTNPLEHLGGRSFAPNGLTRPNRPRGRPLTLGRFRIAT